MQRGVCPARQLRGWFMYSWASQLLALTAALLLALPPGWCCFTPPHSGASPSAEAERDCCSGGPAHKDHQPTPSHEDCPAAPTSACCCDTAATGPAGPETATPDSVPAALALPADHADLCSAGAGFLWDITPHASSPPPRLLHCVWLC
jgi:hypothetical protein